MAEIAGEMMAGPAHHNTTSPPEHRQEENFSVYDFAQMSCADWDKVYDGPVNQLQFTWWNGLNITRLTLCIWIVASHLALLLLLLGKRVLRAQPKNVLMVNVLLTDILLGVFLVPAKLHFIRGPQGAAGPSCSLSIAWALLNDYYQVCVSLLAVLGVVFERLLYVWTERRGTPLTRRAAWLNCLLCFLLPWLAALLLVVPVFNQTLVQPLPAPRCAYQVRPHYLLLLTILSFLPAALAVFISAPLAGLLDCLRSDHCSVAPSTPRGESLVIAVLVSFLAVFCEAPYFVARVLILTVECETSYCERFNEGINAGMWLRMAKAAVVPFLLLVYSDVRDAVLCRIHYKKINNDHEDEDDDDYKLVSNTRM